MDDALRERVEALERAVTDGDHDLSAVADEAAALDRLDTLESDVADLADRVEELEAATQALRGYVGNIRSVNTDVEQRADAALAKAEALEDRLTETAGPNGHSLADATADDESEPAGEDDDTAVDEWQWGANGHGGDADGTRGEEAGPTTHDGQSQGSVSGAGSQAVTAGTDPRAAETGGGNGPSSDGSGSLAANRTEWGSPGDGADSHHAGAGHSRDAGHLSDTAQQTARQHGDERRCESCGRPHGTSGSSASGPSPETAPAVPGAGTTDEPLTAGGTDHQAAGGTDQGVAPGSDHATGSRGVTGSRSAGDSGEATPGAPTVEALAERDPPVTEGDGVESADADVLPDGADDPLVGSSDDGEAGTLQRIRDLL